MINNLKYVYKGFSRSCNYLKTDTRKLLYNAAIASRLNYCDTIWDKCGTRNKKRLQSIQNRCARRIVDARPGTSARNILDVNPRTSAKPLLRDLGWLNLENKRKLHKYVLMKKVMNDDGPLTERATQTFHQELWF